MDVFGKNTDSDSEAKNGNLREEYTVTRRKKLFACDNLGPLNMASGISNLGPYSCLADYI